MKEPYMNIQILATLSSSSAHAISLEHVRQSGIRNYVMRISASAIKGLSWILVQITCASNMYAHASRSVDIFLFHIKCTLTQKDYAIIILHSQIGRPVKRRVMSSDTRLL